MLFFISESLADQALGGDKNLIDILSSLGYFWRTGCCLVDGSRAVLESFRNNEYLRDVYSLILMTKQDVVSLYQKIDFFVVLQTEDGLPDIIIDGAVGRSVNVMLFDNRIKLALNIVLCENIRDYDFYVWGAKYFSDIDDDIFQLNTLGYNGGGSVIVESAKHLENFPCLVICDNDRKYPEDDEGDTLKDLRNYYMSARPLLTWRYELKVHEVENMIPLSLLCMAWGSKGFVKKMKSCISNANYGSFFSFFDFKEGFRRSTLREMNNSHVPSFSNFVSMFRSLGLAQQKINDVLASTYKKNEPALLHGLSKDLMKIVLDFLSSNNLTQPVIADGYQEDDWNNIMRMIWSIGCANRPRRV